MVGKSNLWLGWIVYRMKLRKRFLIKRQQNRNMKRLYMKEILEMIKGVNKSKMSVKVINKSKVVMVAVGDHPQTKMKTVLIIA